MCNWPINGLQICLPVEMARGSKSMTTKIVRRPANVLP